MNNQLKCGGLNMHTMGIIGYGGMASYHFKQLKDYSRLTIKGVYDLNPERMEVAVEEGLVAYDSKESLLQDPDIDIVLIATTNDVHKELVIEALQIGKHVICEKPVTLSSEELIEIMDVAKTTDRVFTIDQNRRTNRDFILMKDSVEKGLLGDVYLIESRVEGSRGMPKGWRTIKNLGGGMMLDWGVHLIDQLLFMIDKPVVNVFCKMNSIEYKEVDDNFRLSLSFEGGLTAQIEVATNNYITHPRWYVLGSEGSLEITDWECEGKIVRCKDKDSVWEDEIIYTKAGPTKTMAPRRQDTMETIEIHEPTEVVDHISVVYDSLIDAIEGIKPLQITPEQALRVMKVMEAAFESESTKQAIITNI